MKQKQRKSNIYAGYSDIYKLFKQAEKEELKIRKILEIRRDKSIAKFKEKFGFSIALKKHEII